MEPAAEAALTGHAVQVPLSLKKLSSQVQLAAVDAPVAVMVPELAWHATHCEMSLANTPTARSMKVSTAHGVQAP